jgi:hypothetical protein
MTFFSITRVMYVCFPKVLGEYLLSHPTFQQHLWKKERRENKKEVEMLILSLH